ncbi:MAG: aldehyde dehydrogenase family protein, partial [Planifilum fulgidum]
MTSSLSSVRVEPVRQYIAGKRVESAGGETFETVNPADNRPITTVPAGDERDIDRAVAAAKEAFAKGPWRRMKIDERIRILERIAEGILENAEELARLETLDTGLPIKQTRGQIRRAGQNFRFFADLARHRLTGNAYPVDGTFLNYTVRRPVGVAGLITPWNTPFMLSTWKLAP